MHPLPHAFCWRLATHTKTQTRKSHSAALMKLGKQPRSDSGWVHLHFCHLGLYRANPNPGTAVAPSGTSHSTFCHSSTRCRTFRAWCILRGRHLVISSTFQGSLVQGENKDTWIRLTVPGREQREGMEGAVTSRGLGRSYHPYHLIFSVGTASQSQPS